MTKNNLILERFIAFGESKGGFSEVGRAVGKHPAVFYNLKVRNAKPSVETLEEVYKAYPDLNLDWLITGRGAMFVQNSAEITALRRENQLLQLALEGKGVTLGKCEAEEINHNYLIDVWPLPISAIQLGMFQ